MAPLPPGINDEADEERADDAATGTPRWVKVLGVAFLVLVLLTIIMIATGHNGPGRHFAGHAGFNVSGASVLRR